MNRSRSKRVPNTCPGSPAIRCYAPVLAVALGIGLSVLRFYPQIYGGDPILRIINWERLQLGYQMPMIQVVVHLATRISPDPVFLRVVLIAVTALGACGMAALARSAFDGAFGLYAGVLFASNHFIVYLGNSPFQEGLELALLLWGVALVFGESGTARRAAGYALVAAACLTRYEAWFLAAGGALAQVLERRPSAPRALAIAVRWGIAPLAWLAWNLGVSPAGSVLFDPALRPARLWRIPYVIGATLNHVTSAVTLLALLGLFLWYRDPVRRRQPAIRALLAAGLLFLLTLPLTAMGVLPDYDRYVTNREAHYLLPILFLMASVGLGWVRERLSPAAVVAVLIVILAYEAVAAKKTLDQSVNEGNLQTDVALARRVSELLGPGQRALVFARPFPPGELEHFFEMLRRRQGEAGVAAAQRRMAAMNTWPLDFARIWVHAPRVRSRLVPVQAAAQTEPAPTLAIVFDDYAPAADDERAILDRVRSVASRSERFPPASPARSGAVLYLLSSPGSGSP